MLDVCKQLGITKIFRKHSHGTKLNMTASQEDDRRRLDTHSVHTGRDWQST